MDENHERSFSGAVHISGHGVLSSAVADHQGITLGPGSAPDATLDSYDVRLMPISRWNVVTLGICNGGVIRYGAGDEPYGLVPAFQTAGARDLIAPIWKVNQSGDREFFRRFYVEMATSDPASAYRNVARALIRDGIPPRDWAGYAIFGS
jgi:CHAT domain-containing protein